MEDTTDLYWQLGAHRVHGIKFGKGKQLLLAFHGYGDRASLFVNLKTSLEKHYTVIALDFPYHGKTEWASPSFSPQDIVKLIQQVLEQEEQSRFSLMVYSMGGRVPFAILPYFSNQVQRIFWLAPAGFKPTLSYNKWLFPSSVRRFLRWVVRHPKWIVHFLTLGHKLRILNEQTYQIFLRQLQSEKHRQQLFNIWVSLASFPLKRKVFKKLLIQQEIPCHFFYGKSDEITPAHSGQKFVSGLPQATLDILAGDHFFVRNTLNAYLSNWLDNSTQKKGLDFFV